MKLSGAFTKANETQSDLWIGEFHAEMTLDDGEKIRAIFPEAISLPTDTSFVIPNISLQDIHFTVIFAHLS